MKNYLFFLYFIYIYSKLKNFFHFIKYFSKLKEKDYKKKILKYWYKKIKNKELNSENPKTYTEKIQ